MTNERNQPTTSCFLSSFHETSGASSSSCTPPKSTTPITWLSQPGEHDIVCGRGKSISAGNLKFRDMILARRDEYQTTVKRQDKSRITADIVQALRAGPSPSRFLLKDSETHLYREVDMEYAREKVSHALRSRRSSSGPNSCPRRRRQTRKRAKEWSSEEEAHIQMLLREQQQLLQSLIER